MKFHIPLLFFCFIFLYELSPERSSEAMKKVFSFKKKKTLPVYYPDEIHTVSFLPKEPESWKYVTTLATAIKSVFGYTIHTMRDPKSEGVGYEGLTYEKVGSHEDLQRFLDTTDLGPHFSLVVRETHKVNRGASSSGQTSN